MSTKNKIIIALVLIIGAGIVYGVNYGLTYLRIATAYAAKMSCSCHYVSGRDLSDIKNNDLYAASFVNVENDEKEQIVTASFHGLSQVQAMYRPGLGCILMNGATKEEINQLPTPEIRRPRGMGKEIAPLSPDIDSVALWNAINATFEEQDRPNPKTQTRAVVVMHKGEVIAEKYRQGYNVNTKLGGWSMTKSVTHAMIGVMVRIRNVDINAPTGLKEWQNDERKNITLHHLLQMQSGLDWEERYDKPSDATNMLFASKSTSAAALNAPYKQAPGKVFYYSSGTTNILQEYMRRQFKDPQAYVDLPYQFIFRKLGMSSPVMEPDASGTYVGSSFMYADARDWALFGQLYLQDGVWNDERILPEGWAKYAATDNGNSEGMYGAHFWMDRNDKDLPADFYQADGFEGQYINIIPSKSLVIVRLGCTQGGAFDNSAFVKAVLKALP